MKRRELLKAGALGLGALALGSTLPGMRGIALAQSGPGPAPSPTRLRMVEALKELADGRLVYVWAFASGTGAPKVPGEVLVARQGQGVDLLVANELDEPHAFSIPGVVKSASIPPGGEARVRFTAPKAGTYLYLDPLDEPVNRVLGLHGAFVSLPPLPPAGRKQTPYGDPTPAVQRLFDDLGSAPQFPGDPWRPERTFVWLFHQIDPVLHGLAQAGRKIDPARFRESFEPRFFTINGRSGLFSAPAPDTHVDGFEGQPPLLRTLNAGLVTHSPHIHGNHVFQIAIDGVVQQDVFFLDTWSLPPLSRRDILHPLRKPPDVPPAAWPPREERFPLVYPMHCHVEMSQTFDGGGYPWGAVTDWSLLGPLRT